MGSGAGTNLKVGRGTHAGKISVAPLHFSGFTTTITRFGERFRDDKYSLVSFLFAVLLLTVPPVPSHLLKWGGDTCPRAQPFVKVGGDTCPRALWSRRRWRWGTDLFE